MAAEAVADAGGGGGAAEAAATSASSQRSTLPTGTSRWRVECDGGPSHFLSELARRERGRAEGKRTGSRAAKRRCGSKWSGRW